MSVAPNSQGPGSASIRPDGDVIAGSSGTWTLEYTAGSFGMQPGGGLQIDTDTDTDWELPQIAEPAGDDFLSVETPDDCGLIVQIVSNVRQRFVLTGRPLSPGESIRITFGDRSGGGRGSRSQTFAEPRRVFRVNVDVRGDRQWATLQDSPALAIVGGDAASLVAQVPSDAVVSTPFTILVRAEDIWGNAAAQYRGTVRLEGDGIEFPVQSLQFDASLAGVARVEGCVARSPGVFRIIARDNEKDLESRSNPIIVYDQEPQFRLRWGDLHGGQVADASKIEDFFRYARDVAGIDFVSYQRNDHSMSPDDYRIQQSLERDFYEPGTFVSLPGVEWSGTTELGGHHNLFFRRFDQPARRSEHRGIVDRSEEHLDLHHIADVYEAYRGTDTVITPHVGGEHSDLAFHDPTLEPALEVTSDHGSFNWFLEDSLRRGYRMGFLGGSDSHNARPGNDRPGHQLRRYSKSGLTGLYVRDLTIEGVLDATTARCCFATTGARIICDLSVDGHVIGSEYLARSRPEIQASIHGTAPIEEVHLMRGLDRIYPHPIELRHSPGRVRISWQGASKESSYSGLIWDGRITLNSGRIIGYDRVRFDSPRSYVSQMSERELSFHSWICGYRSSLLLDLDVESELDIVVSCTALARVNFGGRGRFDQVLSHAPREQVALTVRPEELVSQLIIVEVGELDRRLTVELAPETEREHVAFTFVDKEPVPGVNPYWIWARQLDGEMLWSSPVFADYAPDPLGNEFC